LIIKLTSLNTRAPLVDAGEHEGTVVVARIHKGALLHP